MSHQLAYEKAFTELNDAITALRRQLVTLKRFGIIQPEQVQHIFKKLRQKYYFAHMNGHVLGVNAMYVPKKKSV